MFNRDKSVIVSWFCTIAFAFALAFGVSVEAATVYMWRDDSGVKQYSDTCPPGETCMAKNFGGSKNTDSGGGGGKGKKGKSWQNADTTGTDTTDSGTSTSSGDTTDTSSTSGDTSSGGTTAGTDTTTTEPTTGGDTTTSGDTTTAGDTTTTDTTDPTSTDTQPVADGNADLQWDPVVDASLSGYRLFYAMAGTEYQAVDVGNTTTYTMTGLESGKRYYFRVAAYDSFGNQSGFSNEVYKDMP